MSTECSLLLLSNVFLLGIFKFKASILFCTMGTTRTKNLLISLRRFYGLSGVKIPRKFRLVKPTKLEGLMELRKKYWCSRSR